MGEERERPSDIATAVGVAVVGLFVFWFLDVGLTDILIGFAILGLVWWFTLPIRNVRERVEKLETP